MRAKEFEDIGRRGFLKGMLGGLSAAAVGRAQAKKTPSPSDQRVDAIKSQVRAPSDIETVGLSMNSSAEHLLAKTAKQAGIKGVELAQFLAQTRHESADFSRMKEIGGKLDFKKYDPKHNPHKAKILGNKLPGDGDRYKGRGYIQITGRDNYRMAGRALGIPLEERPELAATPEVAAKIAVWYWQTRVASKVNNFNDTAAVTRAINPGLRGLQDRHAYFQDYKRII